MQKASRTAKSPEVGVRRPRLGLSEIYEDGKRILEILPKPEEERSRNAKIEELAKEKRVNAAELWKRVRFAQEYNEKALKELLCFEKLAWGHVRKLLTVEDVKERCRYAAEANNQEWSPRRLTCEIEARQKLKSFGGRPTKPRPLTPGTLYGLKQEVDQMLNLLNAIDCDDVRRLSKSDMTVCRKLRGKVVEKFDELKSALREFTKKLDAVCG